MIIQTIHILEWLPFIFLSISGGYVAFFSLASLLPSRSRKQSGGSTNTTMSHRFIVFIPAYHEDGVIRQSVQAILQQDYPQNDYQVVVISDHMSDEANAWLSQQPITLLLPTFEKSSKAKALQYAIANLENDKSRDENIAEKRAVILDADNIVATDFLSRLNHTCQQGYQAIQCHRTAKNSDNEIAALDGLSEEINNTLFRYAHNNIGLPSALIGSGMCFDFQWFATHVNQLNTAVEDRELEALLLRNNIYVHYAKDILVMDEKVASKDNFQRQRLRWMTGQIQSLFSMLPYIPTAIRTGNIGYIDKTLQQALVPRSIMLMLLPLLACVITLIHWPYSLKWWGLLLIFIVSLFIAIPRQLRTHALFGKAIALPSLIWRMTKNLARIDKNDTTFHHTDHITS
jgi:cellulose synthase/poly-beta-1,6-N-acetylglucosamine synthase-like glycosyltransferase